MKYEESLLLLPCHSLEDFPLYHEGADADGLLAAWTALWHPALLATTRRMPAWRRSDDPPEEVANRLIVVPGVAMQDLPTGFVQRVKTGGGLLLKKLADREELVRQALAPLDDPPAIDPEVVADFFALSYCYLQVELLTRQMHYASSLDEVYFEQELVLAAETAAAGDLPQSEKHRAQCFTLLAEEREHYYGVEVNLLDLTLVAETTLGPDLWAELEQDQPINLLLTVSTLERIAREDPPLLERIRERLTAGKLGLISGDVGEPRHPLMSLESIRREIANGQARIEETLGRRARVYGRRRFGLTPMLPLLLHGLGFEGALHATLDDGRFPEGTQTKLRWEATDGTPLEAIARAPKDAGDSQALLDFCNRLGDAISHDHVATMLYAHWPGQRSRWYDDLRRAAGHTDALGKFTTVEEYFERTDLPSETEQFTADQYRSPYLKQAIIRKQVDPLSTSVRYWRRQAMWTQTMALRLMAAAVSGDPLPESNLAAAIDAEAEPGESGPSDALDAQLAAAREQAIAALTHGATEEAAESCVVVNPGSLVRRTLVSLPEFGSGPTPEQPVYAAGSVAGETAAIVDVPAMGFATLAPGAGGGDGPLLAEEGLLRNEFFEVLINPTTGGVRSLHDYVGRTNRVSQLLGLRLSGEGADDGVYSEVRCDASEVVEATTLAGAIRSHGELLHPDSGERLAGFEQTLRVTRGSRLLEIEITLDPVEPPRADPWNSYYACRFAWASEGAELLRGVHSARQATRAKRFEAPQFLEIADGDARVVVLTGGLPFHRRVGQRMLDSLLLVRGERARTFRLAIGVDLPYPAHAAVDWLCDPVLLPGRRTNSPTGWLFHLDARNVQATWWNPVVEQGQIVGFQTRLLETMGRPAKLRLGCFRELTFAQKQDFLGRGVGPCDVEEGRAIIDLAGSQWVQVEARWA